VVTLTANTLSEAAACEPIYDLAPQDAIVYASVIDHLGRVSNLLNWN
jgi:hypothetical protein